MMWRRGKDATSIDTLGGHPEKQGAANGSLIEKA
jgi:hypothetical protein